MLFSFPCDCWTLLYTLACDQFGKSFIGGWEEGMFWYLSGRFHRCPYSPFDLHCHFYPVLWCLLFIQKTDYFFDSEALKSMSLNHSTVLGLGTSGSRAINIRRDTLKLLGKTWRSIFHLIDTSKNFVKKIQVLQEITSKNNKWLSGN